MLFPEDSKSYAFIVATAGESERKRRLVERSGLDGLGGDLRVIEALGVGSPKLQDLEFIICFKSY